MKDLLGQRFGRLLVIKQLETRYHSSINWLCLCQCGVKVTVPSARLVHDKTKSCGCYNLDLIRERSTTHGETINNTVTTEFHIWAQMIARCQHPTHISYENYGGRGIKVCERWANSFENFLEDMGRRPSKQYSLDRFPNNDGNYGPGNCRWATRKQQAGNRRSNVWLEYGGRKMIMADWAIELKQKDQKLISYHLRMGKSFSWVYEYLKNKTA